MGELGNGFVVGGGFPPMDEPVPGVKFANELLGKYRTGKRVPNIMYVAGIIEAMTQTEAMRLTLKEVPFGKLTPRKVLENGFYKIKNLNTGGLSSTPLTYGPGDIEGVDKVRVDQIKNGKIVKQGTWPCRHLYKR
jgi:hypothetical protein